MDYTTREEISRLAADVLPEDIESRVDLGMAFLDLVYEPHWPARIDLPSLNVRDHNHCVGAQLEGTFYRFLMTWWPNCDDMEGNADYAVLGFASQARTFEEADTEFAALTREWARRIGLRQEELAH